MSSFFLLTTFLTFRHKHICVFSHQIQQLEKSSITEMVNGKLPVEAKGVCVCHIVLISGIPDKLCQFKTDCRKLKHYSKSGHCCHTTKRCNNREMQTQFYYLRPDLLNRVNKCKPAITKIFLREVGSSVGDLLTANL